MTLWLASILACGFACGFGCARDDILVAADERSPAKRTVTSPPAAPPLQPAGPSVAGGAGVVGPGEPVPGVPVEPLPGVATPGSPGSPGEVRPGVPGEPVPGVAPATAAGVPSAPAPGVPVAPKPAPAGAPQPNSGPQVAISGSVQFDDYKRGSVRVTVFDADHSKRSATPPRVLGVAEVAAPGSFTVNVPVGSGKVYIEGSVDEDGDGRPSPQEPQGKADRYPVTVGSTLVTDMVIVLERRAPPPSGEKRDDF